MAKQKEDVNAATQAIIDIIISWMEMGGDSESSANYKCTSETIV